ncbi:hypothetical protein Kyoto34B_04930 [Helicobacter pylori]|nr:hypothetical protein JP0105_04450 [Helicobacter pylori]
MYANNLWDLLNPKVGGEYVHWVKGSQYCAWWEFAGCLKNVWGANHKGYDAGNAANYLSSQNYQAIFVGSGNETGTYSLSGFTNYVGGNLTINLGNSVVLDLSGSNSFTSYQGYHQGKDDVSFNVGAINLNGALEVGNRVGSGAGTHTGTATLNLNANKVNINSNISTFKTSQVNIGNANSAITIGSVSLNGDTCSSLARVGVGANCSTSGPSYSFRGTTNATNTAFSNASGSFTFEENATFSGAKLNGGHSFSIKSLKPPIIPPLIAVVLILKAQALLMAQFLVTLHTLLTIRSLSKTAPLMGGILLLITKIIKALSTPKFKTALLVVMLPLLRALWISSKPLTIQTN